MAPTAKPATKSFRRSLPEVESFQLVDVLGVGVAISDSAHVDATLNIEEAFVAPAGAPRVLDHPVIHATFCCAIADGENGMVHILWTVFAGRRGVDSTGVIAEIVNDLEGYGDWLLIDGLFEFNLIARGDVHRLTDREDKLRGFDGALSILSVVRVAFLRCDASGVV